MESVNEPAIISKEQKTSSLDELILYAGAFGKDDNNRCALTLLDPKTGKYKVILRESGTFYRAVPFDDRILCAGKHITDFNREPGRIPRPLFGLLFVNKYGGSKTLVQSDTSFDSVATFGFQILYTTSYREDKYNNTLTHSLSLLDPRENKRIERLARENRPISSAVPFGVKVLYACDRRLHLFDLRTERNEVLARENDLINTAVPFGDQILYAGEFSKDGKDGCTLTLLDPETKKYEVLARENGPIRTAVPYGNQILYAGGFVKDGKDGFPLTLFDPKTENYEVLARESRWIHTAVPVSRKTFGGLLE